KMLAIIVVLLLFAVNLFPQGGVAFDAHYVQPPPVVVAPGQLVTFGVDVAPFADAMQANTLPLPLALGGMKASIFDLLAGAAETRIPLLSVTSVELATIAFTGVALSGPRANLVTVQIPFELRSRGTTTAPSGLSLQIVADTQTTEVYTPRIGIIVQD